MLIISVVLIAFCLGFFAGCAFREAMYRRELYGYRKRHG